MVQEEFGQGPSRSAGFANWRIREDERFGSDRCLEWQSVQPSFETKSKLAVVVHVGPGQVVQPLLDSLVAVSVQFDLFITNSSGRALHVDTVGLVNLGHLVVLDGPDQGRDMLPLVTLVNTELLNPYELVLKLTVGGEHGKLLDSVSNVDGILGTFTSDRGLGILGGREVVVGEEVLAGNAELVTALLQRFQLGIEGRGLVFVPGGNYWARGFVLQGLRALQSSEWDFEIEYGQVDGTAAHALERVIGILADEAGYDVRSVTGEDQKSFKDLDHRFHTDSKPAARARIFVSYSSSFHSEGFGSDWQPRGLTNWAETAAAKPVFLGQAQPLIPEGLGYYDSRVSGVIEAQTALAAGAGVEGFIFDYAWDEVDLYASDALKTYLESRASNPFYVMLRVADNQTDPPLLKPVSTATAALAFSRLIRVLSDSRYALIGGCPVVGVSGIDSFANPVEVFTAWRQLARDHGFPDIHLTVAEEEERPDEALQSIIGTAADSIVRFAPKKIYLGAIPKNLVRFSKAFRGTARRYDLLVNHVQRTLFEQHPFRIYPGVTVAHDTTARRRNRAVILVGANPFTFRRWLDSAVSSVAHLNSDERVVIVENWNDWTSGSVLEPSTRFGSTYLLAMRETLLR